MYSGNYTGRELNERFSSESKSCRPGIRRERELTGLYGIYETVCTFNQTMLTFLIRYKQIYEIGLQLRQEVLHDIYMDHVYNIGQDNINSTITQHEHNDYTINFEDFLINSLPILILGHLLSILILSILSKLSFLLEFIYYFCN